MSQYVYFVRPIGGGPIKIGRSCDPTSRLAALEAWSPYPLELMCLIPGDKLLERNVQDCFTDCHYHGEWFHPVNRLLRAIELLRKGIPVETAIDLKDIKGNSLRLVQVAAMARNGTSDRRRAGMTRTSAPIPPGAETAGGESDPLHPGLVFQSAAQSPADAPEPSPRLPPDTPGSGAPFTPPAFLLKDHAEAVGAA